MAGLGAALLVAGAVAYASRKKLRRALEGERREKQRAFEVAMRAEREKLAMQREIASMQWATQETLQREEGASAQAPLQPKLQPPAASQGSAQPVPSPCSPNTTSLLNVMR